MGGACWCSSVLINLEESTADRSAYSAVISMARRSLKRCLPCSFVATSFTPIGSVLCRLCSSAESFPQQTLLSGMIVSSDVRDIVRHTSDGSRTVPPGLANRIPGSLGARTGTSTSWAEYCCPCSTFFPAQQDSHKELDQGRKRRPRSPAGRE